MRTHIMFQDTQIMKRLVQAFATTLVCLWGTNSYAVPLPVIVLQDAFTGDGALVGRTPDTVNLPGGTWQRQGNPGWTTDRSGGQARLGADAGVGVSIASAGSYTKPTVMRLEGDIDYTTATDDAFPLRNIGLGFFPSPLSGGVVLAGHNFTGINLDKAGNVNLLQVSNDGNPAYPTAITLGNFGGAFTTGLHHMSYDVDTTTGNISNLIIDSTPISTPTVSIFTDAATAFVGMYGSSASGATLNLFDNVTLSTVPEPSAMVLAGIAVLGLGLLNRTRRKT